MFNPDEFGSAMGEMVLEALGPLRREIEELKKRLAQQPDFEKLVRDAVASEVRSLPVAKDGKDGKDADMPAIEARIAQITRDLVKEFPAPRDGLDGKDGEAGRDGRDGKDGVDGKSFTIEEADSLLQEKMARWELDFERRALITLEKAVDRMPKAPAGKDGVDGKDGLGFDDLSVEHDGGRLVTLNFQRGASIKSFDLALPVVIDQGVFREGREYQAGDGATWAGSYWIAQKSTKAKPDSDEKAWRLAVKKGRDGKDGRDGIDKTAPVRLKE